MQQQNFIVRNIPNLFTLLNLLSGCFAIVYAFHDNLLISACFVMLGVFFDFIDGMAARLLDAQSTFGKELDSLADIVTFGVAPGVLMFQMLNMSLVFSDSKYSFELADSKALIINLSAFLITIFSAIRLAKFNAEDNQKDYFLGLPTPASAFFVSSLALLISISDVYYVQNLLFNFTFLLSVVIILSVLMVVNIRMFSLKFTNFQFKENALRYIFLIVSAGLLVVFNMHGLPMIVILYILLSFFGAVKK